MALEALVCELWLQITSKGGSLKIIDVLALFDKEVMTETRVFNCENIFHKRSSTIQILHTFCITTFFERTMQHINDPLY